MRAENPTVTTQAGLKLQDKLPCFDAKVSTFMWHHSLFAALCNPLHTSPNDSIVSCYKAHQIWKAFGHSCSCQMICQEMKWKPYQADLPWAAKRVPELIAKDCKMQKGIPVRLQELEWFLGTFLLQHDPQT